MFEAQVAYYLNEYLGKYVEGIDTQSLTYVDEIMAACSVLVENQISVCSFIF